MVCRKCNEDYPVEYFRKHRTGKNGEVYLRRQCKLCQNKKRSIRFEEFRKVLQKYKSSKGCSVCGFSDFRALQFHHRNKEEKEFNLSEIVRTGSSMNRIMSEIVKCDVVCANCHQILHFEERNRGD